jgi:hypothetical protein
MELAELVRRVRTELGDPRQQFRSVMPCDGTVAWFNLPKENIDAGSLTVDVITAGGATVTALEPGVQYTLDSQQGQVLLAEPPAAGSSVLFAGASYSLFTDEDMLPYLRDAVTWHCYGREMNERYRTPQGFIAYRRTPMTMDNLPPVEEPLLAMRAVWNLLWVLAGDASTDVNVQTAEGTVIDRGQRYRQIMQQIQELQSRYEKDCALVNGGPYRWEIIRLRRVSKTTGRLVPLYRDRDYDDFAYPTRLIPPIDARWEDNSGIPSQLYFGYSGYGGS